MEGPPQRGFRAAALGRTAQSGGLRDGRPDGYPSTHFVGNAGLGRGARRLAADDPRAGPFGLDRVTRTSDARDGLSQTILVFGLNEPAGSWASHGDATLRELTREPFVNGPDGLGTGQKDSMLVLMADGSVRTLARDIDPQVMRGLVAMSDQSLRESETPESTTGDHPQVAATIPAAGPAIGETARRSPRAWGRARNAPRRGGPGGSSRRRQPRRRRRRSRQKPGRGADGLGAAGCTLRGAGRTRKVGQGIGGLCGSRRVEDHGPGSLGEARPGGVDHAQVGTRQRGGLDTTLVGTGRTGSVAGRRRDRNHPLDANR